jgi:hypothetical protein
MKGAIFDIAIIPFLPPFFDEIYRQLEYFFFVWGDHHLCGWTG